MFDGRAVKMLADAICQALGRILEGSVLRISFAEYF